MISQNFYHHIDNGGIAVGLEFDDYSNLKIIFETQYHGYPTVSATLSGLIEPEVLRQIGLHFIKFADKMEEEIKKHREEED